MELEITVPAPLEHQEPIYQSPKKRKVARCGRRWGKTRVAFTSALMGHGPDVEHFDENGGRSVRPALEGIANGWDVVWIAQDYPNLITVVWNEIIEPRYSHLPFVKTNENEHRLEFPGLGSLYLRSAEAIGGVRGIGSRLKGVIIDEAAWLDLEKALKDVILATLLDNDGWLILMSTTNGGLDGNADKRIPSYFNVICQEIAEGKRPEWAEFYGTAADNPRISPEAFAAFVAEYEPGSVQLEQEVYAKLIVGGAGLAFPSLEKSRHLVKPFPIPAHWPIWGAFDWGYGHPFAFGLFTSDERGRVILADSVGGRKLEPHEQADRVRSLLKRRALWADGKPRIPPRIYAGHDAWSERKARGESVPTIAEEWRGFGLQLVKASIARVAGANNCRRYFRWREPAGDGETFLERTPLFAMMDTENNRRVWSCLTTRVNDPDHPEDVLKTDANADTGLGGDDDYDMVRYGLASRPIAAQPPKKPASEHEDVKSWQDRARARASKGEPSRVTVPRARDLVEAD